MSDLIRLLPDSVANQIAAGEVIQRPASAAKELLENAIDAGATSIKLIVRDAGKALIQVIDNGCGMSERDARICFERHATSKIQNADDLLSIRTLGFRGEAMASIAAIAQVEIKTKRMEDEIGTCVQAEGSVFKSQFPATCPDGTSVSAKNLFFNVPARRNFLKSNQLELKYIIEEFFRVALVNPHIAFTFYSNDKTLYQLQASSLKLRIISLFGNAYSQRLVPVEQESNIINIDGFIGKPEFAKKTRGEQYFFTNGRFIKNPYLHHSIENAFQELIPKDAFPTYFIYLTADPATIDVNIHPTKTEVNFQEIKSVYAILHSAVRQSIGKFSITPTLDFDNEPSLLIPPAGKDQPLREPTIRVDSDYNPFEKRIKSQMEIQLSSRNKNPESSWQKLYDPLKNISFEQPADTEKESPVQKVMADLDNAFTEPATKKIFQLKNRFIVTYTKSGIVIIDQQNAHERILYEHFIEIFENRPVSAQKQLLPQTLKLHPSDTELLKEHRDDLNRLGFEISDFGKDTFLIEAIPVDFPNRNIPELVEKMIESLKNHPDDPAMKRQIRLAHSLAKNSSISRDAQLQPEEMTSLVEQLFACKIPDVTPDGKPTMVIIGYEDLMRKFK